MDTEVDSVKKWQQSILENIEKCDFEAAHEKSNVKIYRLLFFE